MAKSIYIVFIAGVATGTVAKLRTAVTDALNDGYDEVNCLISSSGGSVIEGLNIAAYLRTLPIPVIMHNIGQIDSVANVIYAAGKTRKANPNSSFLFHGVLMGYTSVSFTEAQLNEQYKIAKRSREDIAKSLSIYVGMSLPDVNNLLADDAAIISANEAKRKGIVHEVVDVTIPKGVRVISIGNE